VQVVKGTVEEVGETIEAACHRRIDKPDPDGELWREDIL